MKKNTSEKEFKSMNLNPNLNMSSTNNINNQPGSTQNIPKSLSPENESPIYNQTGSMTNTNKDLYTSNSMMYERENSIDNILDIRKQLNQHYKNRQNEPRGQSSLDFHKQEQPASQNIEPNSPESNKNQRSFIDKEKTEKQEKSFVGKRLIIGSLYFYFIYKCLN